MKNKIVTREEWLQARTELLAKEKGFTQARDQMTKQIRELPWVKLEKEYLFEGSNGQESLEELFGVRRQLAVYHFMLGPDWKEGCRSCSFWADNFDGISKHLANRDISFVVISRAPLAVIEPFKQRMGWSFKWVSSFESDFNFDFHVSFKPTEMEEGNAIYNYAPASKVGDEMPGASFFRKDQSAVYHTYSTYGRGIDLLNGAYNWLDLSSKGRGEDEMDFTMGWVRHHDKYE